MIDGPTIRAARERAGWTQQQLASRMEVTLRTVGNWERGETVPRGVEARIRTALADYLDDAHNTAPNLRQASDAELLGEIARRFARHEQESQVRNAIVHGLPEIQQVAARTTGTEPGTSATRRAQDQIESGSQDPGDMEPR